MGHGVKIYFTRVKKWVKNLFLGWRLSAQSPPSPPEFSGCSAVHCTPIPHCDGWSKTLCSTSGGGCGG